MDKEEKREYYKANREHFLKIKREKLNTLLGRAENLLKCYNREDKKYNRGEGDLTIEWIAEQIKKGCTYKDQCGTTDWKKVGINRKDNSLPHTKDNCEPCCVKCNQRLYGEEVAKKVYQYTLDGKLVKIWNSATDAARELGYNRSCIKDCCHGGKFQMYNGEKKWYKCTQYKGYRWSYVPL